MTASVANVWTSLALTWDVTLPEGTYAVIGFTHVSGSPIAARLVFPGSPFKPATISTSDTVYRTHAAFYEGRFGVFGKFAAFAPPSLEVLCSGAISAHQIYVRVVRIG